MRAVKLVLSTATSRGRSAGAGAVGVAPIPGPFDEAVLLLVAAILFYRDRLKDARQHAAPEVAAS